MSTNFTDEELADFYANQKFILNNGCIQQNFVSTPRHAQYEYDIVDTRLLADAPALLKPPKDQLVSVNGAGCGVDIWKKPAVPQTYGEIVLKTEIDKFAGKNWAQIFQNLTKVKTIRFNKTEFRFRESVPINQLNIGMYTDKTGNPNPDTTFELLELFLYGMGIPTSSNLKTVAHNTLVAGPPNQILPPLPKGSPSAVIAGETVRTADNARNQIVIKVVLKDKLKVGLRANKVSKDGLQKIKYYYESQADDRLTPSAPIELEVNLPAVVMPKDYIEDKRFKDLEASRPVPNIIARRNAFVRDYFKENIVAIRNLNPTFNTNKFFSMFMGKILNVDNDKVSTYIQQHANKLQNIINDKHSFQDIQIDCKNDKCLSYTKYNMLQEGQGPMVYDFSMWVHSINIPLGDNEITIVFEEPLSSSVLFTDYDDKAMKFIKNQSNQATESANTWLDNKGKSIDKNDNPIEWYENANANLYKAEWVRVSPGVIGAQSEYVLDPNDNPIFYSKSTKQWEFITPQGGEVPIGPQIIKAKNYTPNIKPEKNNWYYRS